MLNLKYLATIRPKSKLKQLEKDIRGAALIYVIVAAAVIVLLGGMATTAAYGQLKTIQAQKLSENNFYDADSIMNSIVSGLENDISTAYEKAYTSVITKYTQFATPEDAKSAFNSIFLSEMTTILNESADYETPQYSVEHLQEYVQKTFEDNNDYTVSAVNGHNYLDILDDNGLMLRNLHVTYENSNGYFDEITTDVQISIPNVDFSTIKEPLNITTFALVADKGYEAVEGTGLNVIGDLYLGKSPDDGTTILLKPGSALNVAQATQAIASGLVKLETASELEVGNTGADTYPALWTENLEVGQDAKMSLSGETYVLDDLELNGRNASADISGEYFGFSRSNSLAKDSSSININGGHSTLDLSELTTMVLGGSSYLASSKVEESGIFTGYNTTDREFGESISVKSNQIAYLVNDSLFDFIPSNPMNYQQYQEMPTDWKAQILSKKLSSGKTYQDYHVSIEPVFSAKDGGTVYLYVDFHDSNDAADYFVDMYSGDDRLAEQLRTYAAEYIKTMTLSDTANLIVNANYPLQKTYDDATLSKEGIDYQKTTYTTEEIDEVLAGFSETYLGDGTEDGDGLKYSVMFKKLINEQALKQFIHVAENSDVEHFVNGEIVRIENGIILNGTTDEKAILIDNEGKDAYETGIGSGLIIATGDVKITGDWTGTIICKGRAYDTAGAAHAKISLTASEKVVANTLSLYVLNPEAGDDEILSVINVFRNYEDYMINRAEKEKIVSPSDIRNCISFTGWSKE